LGGTAELIADGGATAEAAEFFRSRPFLDAEEATHTLQVSFAETVVAIPMVVREIPGAERVDATSIYGYPGATVVGAAQALDPSDVDWSQTELVSVFVRERLGVEPAFTGATERSLVQVHDPAAPSGIRPRLAEQIRQNERRGYTVSVTPGPDSALSQRRAFHALYTETMRRAEAADRYFFDPSYLDRVLEFERSWLLLAATDDGEIAAGAIAAISDGMLHYYLGGTADAHIVDSPFKNVVAEMMSLSESLAKPLNLGGGVRAGDGLEAFKRGFANAELPFRTHELVCDPGEYARLSGGVGAGDFFPAYRAKRPLDPKET